MDKEEIITHYKFLTAVCVLFSYHSVTGWQNGMERLTVPKYCENKNNLHRDKKPRAIVYIHLTIASRF